MTASQLHQGSTYIDMILQGLRRWPERDAIVDAGGLALTYANLEQRIWKFAQALKDAGLNPGDGLAQLAANRVDTYVLMAACLASGIRYTPLHPMGSLGDQLYIINDANISLVVVDVPFFADRGRELRSSIESRISVFALGDADFGADIIALAEACSPNILDYQPCCDDIAWLTYTGGTTGKPKGVILTQGAMAAKSLISLGEWQWPEEIRYLASSPISHAAGFLLIPTFLNGGKVYLLGGFDPDKVLDLVENEGINTLFLVPTMIYALLDHARTQTANLSSIESIIYASAPMSPTRLREALELFGPVLMQCYGQTECVHLTMMRKEEHTLNHPHRLSSCGRPPAGIIMSLLDSAGEPVPQGEVGEVCVRGAAVMRGYWNKPEETAETLRGDWLHTGDLAYQDDEGFYYLVDRAKDLIISGGFNVYPKEVEDVLATHQAVAMSAVIGIPDEKWGEKVAAMVVLRPGQKVNEDDLKAELRELVKQGKGAVHSPKLIEFIEKIPVTALGKTDKKGLRAQFWGSGERQIN
ncbi:MAG: AMP-binding protein [Pseudomonadales bacterium]